MDSNTTVTATFVTGTATSTSWMSWPDQVTLGQEFSSLGVLNPRLNNRQIILTFTRPDATKVVSTTDTFWFIFGGLFFAEMTPDMVGEWSVTAQFLGDATYGAFTTTPRTFDVVTTPMFNVSFTQTGAGAAPIVTYNIEGGTSQQGIVPFTAQIPQGQQITYSYQSTVSGATDTQYVLTGTSPTSPRTINSDLTVTGTYKTQYYVTFAVSPLGGGTINHATGWYDSGSLSIAATANSG